MKHLVCVPSKLEFEALFPDWSFDDFGLMACAFGHNLAISTGIGAVTAINTGQYFERLQIERVLLAGIAGAHPSSGLELGSITQADSETIVDLGYRVDGGWANMDAMGLPLFFSEKQRFGCRYELFQLDKSLPRFHFATLASVSQSPEELTWLQSKNLLVENMEGAYLALAAKKAGIPLSEVRAISNFLGPRNPSLWKIELALKNLKEWIHDVL